MVGKDVGKGGAVVLGEVVSVLFVKHVHFWNTFLDAMCNQILFLTFYYISDIQLVFFVVTVEIMPLETVYHFYYSLP